MNRLVFALLAWVMLGLETGLKDLFTLGRTGVSPSFVVVLAVFVAMHAPASFAVWGGLILGVALDLTASIDLEQGYAPAFVLGPHALGLALGVQAVLTLRGIMMRRNPLSLVFLSVVACGAMEVVVVASHTLRWAYGDPIAWSPTGELLARLGSAIYTGAAGLVLALLLFPLASLCGFPQQGSAWRARRAF